MKIFGIFSIICGVILIILGAMVFIGASQLSPEEIAADPSLSAGVSGMAIFFVLGVIAAIIGLFTGGSLGGSVFSLIVNIVIFVAANKIKKSRNLIQ